MADWHYARLLAQDSSQQHYTHSNADVLNRSSSMASSHKELGARPKQAGENQIVSGCGAQGSLTFQGNNRIVTLDERWTSVTCNVLGKDGYTHFIHDPVDPCILQHETVHRMLVFSTKLPSCMKVTTLKPGLLKIDMHLCSDPNVNVNNILKKSVERIKKAEVQFTSEHEFCEVMLNCLDEKSFRLFESSNARLFYLNKNNSFFVNIVGPDYCSVEDFRNVQQQIEICQRLVANASSIDLLKQNFDENNKSESVKQDIFEKRISCPSNTSADLNTLGVFDDMKKAFAYDCEILKGGILFSCEQRNELSSVVDEFNIYCSRLKRINVDFLPIETWGLLLNDNRRRDKFLIQNPRLQYVKFVNEDGCRLVMLCISQAHSDTIYQSLKKLFFVMPILSEAYTHPMVQRYLTENKNDVCLSKSTQSTNVYAMQYIEKRIEMMNIPFLPVEAWCFLTKDNGRRDIYLKQHVRCEDIAFFMTGDGIVLLCITKADVATIFKSLQECFYKTFILSEILEQPTMQQFLNENKDDVCVCKDISRPNVTFLYVMEYVSEGLEDVLHHYVKQCDAFVSEYLKSYGDSWLRTLEQEHKVKAILSDRFIEFSGDHQASSQMMNKLESCLHTVVQHEEDAEKCKQIAFSDEFQQRIRQIADKNGCSVKTVPVEIEKKCSGTGKAVEGASPLTTWILRDTSNCVSIVCGDVQKMKLDALIIPVNSSLFGEGPLAQGIQPLPSIFLDQPLRLKGKLGEVIEGQFKDDMLCKSGFAVVVSSTGLTGSSEHTVTLKNTDMQKSVLNIISRMKSSGIQCNIGVCVPQDEGEFSIDVNDIIQSLLFASETALWKQFQLYVCVKSGRERWLQKINRSGLTCLWKQSHRRIVDPDVYGIFNVREDTKVDIIKTSLLQIGAECLVVSVGSDFNLLHGFVAKQIRERAGPGLQEELDKSRQSNTGIQKHIIAARPWNLSNIGVKLLVFVVIPHWSKCERSTQKLQVLVEDCLLIADQYYCKSVAFPVFGIGNLEYPMRDVAVAFFDAIDVFKKQSVFQVISQIYISAPVIKKDDSMLQLLIMEEQRRINLKQTQPCFKQKEIRCLSARNSNVVYKVVTKDNSPHLMSGEYVRVHLDPSQDADDGITRTLTQMSLPCGRSKDSLQKKMEDVVSLCEKDRITSICVSLGPEFRFSESDQIKIISGAVDKTMHKWGATYNAAMVYKYLKTVLITVSDAFTFSAEVISSNEDASLLSSIWSKTGQIDNVWKDSSYQLAVYGMNMVIVGESAACEQTLRDVQNMFTTEDEGNGDDVSLYYDAKEGKEEVVQVERDDTEEKSNVQESDTEEMSSSVQESSIQPVIGKDEIDQHVDEGVVVGDDENINFDLMDSEVTAELNPGLVEFLMSVERSAYESWTKWIENEYKIHVESNGSSKLFVRGQLDTIIDFENYLENEFTMLDPFGIDEKHFKTVQKPRHEFLVPMLCQEAQSILQMNSEGIEKLDRTTGGTHLKVVDNGFLIACSPEDESQIHKTILSWQTAYHKLGKKSEKVKTDFQKAGFVVHEAFFKYRSLDVAVMYSDITECDVDCIVSSVNSDMGIRDGIAKQIAAKAGQHYKDVCKKGTLKVCECRSITLGNDSSLNCNGILNVNCFPSTNIKDVGFIYLNEVRESVTNCFNAAENDEYASIAMPMLRTGNKLRFDVSLCAQECFRAIDNGQFKHLKKIIFVAFDLAKVKDFIKVLATATSPKSDQATMLPTSLKLKIKSSKALILIVNQHVAGPEVTARVEFRGDMKQDRRVTKQKLEDRIRRGTDGPLDVLKVPELEDHSDTFIYDAVRCVLQKAKEFKITRIAIPTLLTTDKNWREDEQSCKCILHAVCDFCIKNPGAMEWVQIMSPKQDVIATMSQLVLSSL